MPTQRELLEALKGLQRRSLLEKTGVGFTLQNVVTEYITDYLVEQACREFTNGEWQQLKRHSLLKAQTQDYIRQSQERLILAPVARQLVMQMGKERLAMHLRTLLERLRATAAQAASYVAGNLLNLLLHLKLDVTGYDFSGLAVWQAYLCDAVLPAVNFTGADLAHTVFYENFGQVEAVAFSPDGQQLISGGRDEILRLWDVQRGTVVQRFPPTTWTRAAAFHPTGNLLASGGDDRLLYLWVRTQDGTFVLCERLAGHTDAIFGMAFNPDGTCLATSSGDRTIRLWKLLLPSRSGGSAVPTLVCVSALKGHTSWVRTLCFTPDGSQIISGGDDRSVRVWDVASGQCRHTLIRHTNSVQGVAVHPEGQWLATCALDTTINVWQLENGAYLKTHKHPGPYVGMKITDASGISATQQAALKALGAVEE